MFRNIKSCLRRYFLKLNFIISKDKSITHPFLSFVFSHLIYDFFVSRVLTNYSCHLLFITNSHLEERRKNHEKTSEVVILVCRIGLRVVIVAYEGKCGGSD